MKRNQPKHGTNVRLSIDQEMNVLVNPGRANESDDFYDVTNSMYYDIDDGVIAAAARNKAVEIIRSAVEREGGEPPMWLDAETTDDAGWQQNAKRWLSSQVSESELMHLAENTPWPVYRDGVELRLALERSKIRLKDLREVCIRGAPGGSCFVTVYSGPPADLNKILEGADLPYRVDDTPSDQSEIIGDHWHRISRSSSTK
jgi:hypothetical protein